VAQLFERGWSRLLAEIVSIESSETGAEIALAFIDMHCVEPLLIQYDTERRIWLWRIDCGDGKIWTGNASDSNSSVFIPKLVEAFSTIYECNYNDRVICNSLDMLKHWIMSAAPMDKFVESLSRDCMLKSTLKDYLDDIESQDSEWSSAQIQKTRALYSYFVSDQDSDHDEDDDDIRLD
jgi:hypothetical protein